MYMHVQYIYTLITIWCKYGLNVHLFASTSDIFLCTVIMAKGIGNGFPLAAVVTTPGIHIYYTNVHIIYLRSLSNLDQIKILWTREVS